MGFRRNVVLDKALDQTLYTANAGVTENDRKEHLLLGNDHFTKELLAANWLSREIFQQDLLKSVLLPDISCDPSLLQISQSDPFDGPIESQRTLDDLPAGDPASCMTSILAPRIRPTANLRNTQKSFSSGTGSFQCEIFKITSSHRNSKHSPRLQDTGSPVRRSVRLQANQITDDGRLAPRRSYNEDDDSTVDAEGETDTEVDEKEIYLRQKRERMRLARLRNKDAFDRLHDLVPERVRKHFPYGPRAQKHRIHEVEALAAGAYIEELHERVEKLEHQRKSIWQSLNQPSQTASKAVNPLIWGSATSGLVENYTRPYLPPTAPQSVYSPRPYAGNRTALNLPESVPEANWTPIPTENHVCGHEFSAESVPLFGHSPFGYEQNQSDYYGSQLFNTPATEALPFDTRSFNGLTPDAYAQNDIAAHWGGGSRRNILHSTGNGPFKAESDGNRNHNADAFLRQTHGPMSLYDVLSNPND
ncbi:MAG: hypothetical protein Q9227_000142 [Pyrenula ochraceoflavens]